MNMEYECKPWQKYQKELKRWTYRRGLQNAKKSFSSNLFVDMI